MDAIRKAFERCMRALWPPLLGRRVCVSRTRIRHGLTCEIEEGAWKLTADVPAHVGGRGEAPTPGVFARAALGSGLAIGYMLHAAKRRVPIAALEVEVRSDGDDAWLGLRDAPGPGQGLRYTVTVESAAPEDDVRRVIDELDADGRSLRLASDPQPSRCAVRVVRPREASMDSEVV
jgi:uncharacterized OsmC-like protein